MTWIANLRARFHALFHRRELEEELDAELAHHLAMKQRELASRGGDLPSARLASRRAFGNAALWKEEMRNLWRFTCLESLWSDASYALRVLCKDRVFTAVALVTLTLGIGASTAIFSLLDGLLWRSLPVTRPEALVSLSVTHLPPTFRQWVNGRTVAPTERRQMTYLMYDALQKRQQAFAGMFALGGGGLMELDVNGNPNRVYASVVSGSFFPVLGLRAAGGRLLAPDDDRVGGPPAGWAAVISDELWTKLFARDPRAIGSAITIERVPFTIVGVAPRVFRGIHPGIQVEVWVPLMSLEAIYPNLRWRTDSGSWMTEAYARLTPDVSIDRARRNMETIAPAVLREAEDPRLKGRDRQYFEAMRFSLQPAASGRSWLALSFGPALWVLLAAVTAVLLIAVTNLTSLFLARAAAQRFEIAVRVSLGAPLSRIRRQFLLQTLLLGGAGTGAGLLWARWLAAGLQSAVSAGETPVRIDTSLDLRAFTFLGSVLFLVVLLAGLAPALSAARLAPHQVVKRFAGGSPAWGLRRGLIVLQTALSLTLLGGAGLMLASLHTLLSESTGFQMQQTAFLLPDLFNAGVSRERIPSVYRSLLDEVRELPQIASAAWTLTMPLNGSLNTVTVRVPGRANLSLDQRHLYLHRVSDGYFSAVGIPLLAGADLPPAASERRDVALLSETAAREFFGSDRAALGQRLELGVNDSVEITGVVGDAKYESIREPAPSTLYLPYWRGRVPGGMNLAVRYRGPAELALPALQNLLRKEAGRLPYTQIRTFRENISGSLGSERLLTWLLGGFAVFGVLISATGLAGLFSYIVEQRRKELGIRMALGATPQRIRREIRWQGLILTGVGLAAGGVLSYGLRRSLNAYLFGVAAADPRIWAAGIAGLLLAALAATSLPAWRAGRVDPSAMLREE